MNDNPSRQDAAIFSDTFEWIGKTSEVSQEFIITWLMQKGEQSFRALLILIRIVFLQEIARMNLRRSFVASLINKLHPKVGEFSVLFCSTVSFH
jgi:hypothetical protein